MRLPVEHLPGRLAALCLLLPCITWATWYNENIENGADIIMMDLRWPWWPSGTYYANWNTGFNPKPNNISFYAGFVSTVPDGPGYTPNPDEALQSAFRPGHVWSFWGSDAAGTPVRFLDVAPNLFIMNKYGGEGSSGTLGARGWPFVKHSRWYTMLARVWRPLDRQGNSFVGRWIKDPANGHWHLIAVARLPIPAESFHGNSGFIEPLTNPYAVRSLHRRLGYYRREGQWHKSDTISINKTQYVVVNRIPEGNHEYVAIEYAQRPDLLPQRLTGTPISGDVKHDFAVQQPDLPALDSPRVREARALRTTRQVAVVWEIPPTSSPPLGFKVEAFDSPECRGPALATKAALQPSARMALLDVATEPVFVRLTVTDVFDQTAPPVTVAATPCAPPAGASQADADAVPALAYSLYHKDARRRVNAFYEPRHKPNEEHVWLDLNELADGQLVRQGLARGFDLSVREQRKSGFALVFRGHLRAPSTGLYILYAQIDGAYRVRLGGADTLVWDGQHGTTERAATLHLQAGDHPLDVTHLFDELPATNFRLEWEGPGFTRCPIPLEALRTAAGDAYPVPSVKTTAHGDGTGRVVVQVEPNGHRVDETALFLGRLKLAAAAGPDLSFEGPFAKGTNLLWCRVRFDDMHTVDSQPVQLDVEGRPVDPGWTVRSVGDSNASAGVWQTGPGAFQFFGAGMHTVTREMTGDFTATCRIDGYNGANGEPVNRRAWVGLGAREHPDRRNWSWGRDFHLVQTAADGLRSSPDSRDLGGGRISSYALPAGRPWLRIARRGNIWTAWTSADGDEWELGAYQFKKTRPEMAVGLFFSALPQDALAHYHARVSNVLIRAGAATETIPDPPPTARRTDGQRLTGVVMARSDPKVVVVRSTSRGLLRTENGGRTWTLANGNLTDEDLAVRSVAIHPENPAVMFRASGEGLCRTEDGGRSWMKLDLDGDFDGLGPSALCGEVIDFSLRSAGTVFVGCESEGLFRSDDHGRTWESLGLQGERVTAVKVWPWERYYPATARGKMHLCVTTCPDHWMGSLGRGVPRISTPATSSRSYTTTDGGQSVRVGDQREDTGFYNVIWDKASQNTGVMRYATSHGVQAQIHAGSHMALFPEQKRLGAWKPFTALGATAIGDGKFGRVLTQALEPTDPARLSCSERWAFEWSWQDIEGDRPTGGLIAACGSHHAGDEWWFVYTDGLYYSPDGGRRMRKVLDETGTR